jgi:hypothetical protein
LFIAFSVLCGVFFLLVIPDPSRLYLDRGVEFSISSSLAAWPASHNPAISFDAIRGRDLVGFFVVESDDADAGRHLSFAGRVWRTPFGERTWVSWLPPQESPSRLSVLFSAPAPLEEPF